MIALMVRGALFAVALAAAGFNQSTEEAPESLLTAPLFLQEEPPECRSLRSIRLPYGADAGGRDREEVRAQARSLRRLLAAGADFAKLARTHSGSPAAHKGGVLGTFPPGVLVPEFDRFLFASALDEVSQPIDAGGAIHLLQRIERWAACRQIFLQGKGDEVREKAEALVAVLRGGADFAALAREHSRDAESAARGGAWRIFERGADDALLKRATFEARVGEVFGPLESPLGFHIGRRDPLEGFDEALRESNWVRASAILVGHEKGRSVRAPRSLLAAADLAKEIHALARHRSLDLRELASKHTDEPGGKERDGDLGWIYRKNPNRLRALERLFLVPPGTLLEPVHTDEGWLVLQRTR